MSTLSSASTRAQVLAAYADNASYEEDASIAKCKAFITACRFLLSPQHLVKQAGKGGGGGEMVETDQVLIRDEMTTARAWLRANDSDSTTSTGGGGQTEQYFDSIRD